MLNLNLCIALSTHIEVDEALSKFKWFFKMSNIEVPHRFNQIISLFHFIRFWRCDSISNFNSTISKIVHLIVYVYYPVSLMVGAFTNDNETEQMFLVVLSIVTFVLAIRLYYILWRKDEIIGFINELGTHSIADDELFHRINNKIIIFIKLVSFMEVMLLFAVIAMTIITSPIVSNDKMLPMNIYFPLDWRHNELFYWIAFTFVVYEMMISMSSSLLNPIIWYLMMSCAIKYQVLGYELKNLGFNGDGGGKALSRNVTSVSEGVTSDQIKVSFQMKLILFIKNHRYLQEYEHFLTRKMKIHFYFLYF